MFKKFFGLLTCERSWLFFRVLRTALDAPDLILKALSHAQIPFGASEFNPLLKSLDRASYVALGEKRARLAEDARITLAFFGCIHEDY